MMHGSINVKSPNNTNKWQMEFNSAFKGLKTSTNVRPKPDLGRHTRKNRAHGSIFCTVLHKNLWNFGKDLTLRHPSNAKNFRVSLIVLENCCFPV
jgi:hypothetical protein